MKRRLHRCLFWILAFGPAIDAYAESDGFYCVGNGYLAYELSSSAGALGHTLFVLPLSDVIGEPAKLKIPEFQVHGMICDPGKLEILGWDYLYSFDLTDPSKPKLAETLKLDPPGDSPERFRDTLMNLGGWNRSVRQGRHDDVPLDSPDNRYSYSLQIRGFPVRSKSCTTSVETQVLQLDKTTQRKKLVTLLRGEFQMECR